MTTAAATADPTDPARRRRMTSYPVSLAAVAGPALFTAAWLVLGFLSTGYTMWGIRVENYSAVSQPVSGLGLGATGPYMNAAFVASGVLIIAGAFGIFGGIKEMPHAARRTCAALLAAHGAGAIIDGIFTLESIVLHSFGFMFALSPIVTFPIIGRHVRRIPQWRRFGTGLLLASPLTLILAVTHLATFDPQLAGAGVGVGGLTQRLLLVEIQGWIAACGWLAFRKGGGQRPRPAGTTGSGR